jgi:8-oxo-dGTP pyrophosphatase MutT (NUDIX family)
MIYEYSGGTHRYELALTKGKIDAGESPLEAAAIISNPLFPHLAIF